MSLNVGEDLQEEWQEEKEEEIMKKWKGQNEKNGMTCEQLGRDIAKRKSCSESGITNGVARE